MLVIHQSGHTALGQRKGKKTMRTDKANGELEKGQDEATQAGKVTVRSALAREVKVRERLNPRSAYRFRAYEKRLNTLIGDCALDEFGTEAVVTYFGDRLADGERQGKPVSKP